MSFDALRQALDGLAREVRRDEKRRRRAAARAAREADPERHAKGVGRLRDLFTAPTRSRDHAAPKFCRVRGCTAPFGHEGKHDGVATGQRLLIPARVNRRMKREQQLPGARRRGQRIDTVHRSPRVEQVPGTRERMAEIRAHRNDNKSPGGRNARRQHALEVQMKRAAAAARKRKARAK